MEQYRIENGLDSIDEAIFNKNKDHRFWTTISASICESLLDSQPYQILAAAVPYRPIQSVYKHVRRIRHPMHRRGQWKEAEDVLLIKSVSSTTFQPLRNIQFFVEQCKILAIHGRE